MKIGLKRVYDPKGSGDGTRVLVMRLWPRGIRKDRVDLWLKELGADRALLADWKAGRVTWPERKRRYLRGLAEAPAAAQLEQLRGLAAREPVTLLCACKDERECHRSLLKSVLEAKEER